MAISTPKIDLHLHTTFSDGKLSPTELVRLVARQGVTVAAITDHDSTEGLSEAFEEATKHPGLRLIAGIEISADHAIGQGDLHILGYFLNYQDQQFQKTLKGFRDGRLIGAKSMVDKLTQLGLPLEIQRVQEIAGGASIGRPHIAQAMVERGYIKNVKEAFVEYLQDGGKAYVARPHISMEGAINLIRGVGGVAVLAHPLYMKTYSELLPNLKQLGFAGIEVHYAEFDQVQRLELANQATRHGLLCCGGSDYHGFGTAGEHLPGSAGPPESELHRLEAFATEQKGLV